MYLHSTVVESSALLLYCSETVIYEVSSEWAVVTNKLLLFREIINE